MRVLIGCEFSGTVRRAFRARGFDAWSCDVLPAEDGSPFHIQCDLLEVLDDDWAFACFHPPCTDLAVSGARHFAAKIADGRQARALEFVQRLLDAPVRHIALENPVSVISSKIRKPDQIIQPWQYGHGETKATCLWLKNLPTLKPTEIVEGREPRIHRMAPGPDRWKERSRTYAGIAAAMADQWGNHLLNCGGSSSDAAAGEASDVSPALQSTGRAPSASTPAGAAIQSPAAPAFSETPPASDWLAPFVEPPHAIGDSHACP